MKKIDEKLKPIIKEFFESDFSDLKDFISEKGREIKLEESEIEELNKEKGFVDSLKKKQWVKNQHYIPQFYLRLFANADGRVETLDKDNKRTLKSQSVEHICSDIYFYGIKTGNPDIVSQALECLFGYYEQCFSELYDELVDAILSGKEIKDNVLYELCTFVAISRMRGKYFRDQMHQTSVEIMKKVASMTYQMRKSDDPDDPDDPKIKEISSDEKTEKSIIDGDYEVSMNNAQHIQFISDEKHIRGFANLLFGKRVRIYISDGIRNFVTSDCCVAEVVPEKTGPYGVHFMERIHYFVLSPKILIEFSDPGLPGKKIKRQTIGKEEVMRYNLIRTMYGKYFYSKSKDDFIEEEYTETRINFVDRLYELYPSEHRNDKEATDKIRKIAQMKGIGGKNNYELMKKLNLYK